MDWKFRIVRYLKISIDIAMIKPYDSDGDDDSGTMKYTHNHR